MPRGGFGHGQVFVQEVCTHIHTRIATAKVVQLKTCVNKFLQLLRLQRQQALKETSTVKNMYVLMML